jgi:hypothetical protein
MSAPTATAATKAHSDFNDQLQVSGKEAVRASIEKATKPKENIFDDDRAYSKKAQLALNADRESKVSRIRRRAIVCDVFDLLTMAMPERETLLSPWLQTQSLVMLYAWRGVGKTHAALGIAYALSSGGEFLGWKATRPVSVLYIDGEMPGSALKERVSRIAASSDPEAQPGMLRFITPDLQPDGVMPNLGEYEGQAQIEEALGDAQVIIIDNLSCLVRGGKENEGDSWLPVAEWALRMRATGRSVIFVHHAGKGGQQRGTSKREDLLDVVLLLKRPSDYEPSQGARFEVHFEKARSMYGEDVTPIEAALETTADGRQHWKIRTAESAADEQMIELAEMGMHDAEIAREIGCHRSTVMRALKKARDEGRLSPKSLKKRMA